MDDDVALIMRKKISVPTGNVKALRYVILRATNNNVYPTIDETEIFDSFGNKVSHLDGNVASASSTYAVSGAIYRPAGAIDGVYPGPPQTHQWCPAVGNNANTNRTCWWRVDFAQKVGVNRILMASQISINRVPLDMDIEISEDGTNFSVLAQLRNLSGWVSGVLMPLWASP